MVKSNVLVLGATGMAGHVIYHYLHETGKFNISNLVFRTPLNEASIVANANDKYGLYNAITEQKPDYIINCIGILIRGSNEDPTNAIYINACLPHLLAKIGREINAKLIHISTDCVFSGRKGNYSETDFRDADDIYGRSKALGEVNNDRDLTIRTSIIGPEIKSNGEGLFHWFMHQHGIINGFTKAFWSGITTLELAKVIDASITQKLTGLINITNSEKISKYDLLRLIQDVYTKNDVQINAVDGKQIDKSLVSTRYDFRHTIPSYKTMIEDLYRFMAQNKDKYSGFYSLKHPTT